MKKTLRSALALLLAALLLCGSAAAALAEEPEYTYPDKQYFEADEKAENEKPEDEKLETDYTVQVVIGPYLRGAEQTRLEMLEAGFDSFVYKAEGRYRVMCGKFLREEGADLYRDLIRDNTDRKDAFVTEVLLPESAREEFLAHWKEDPVIVGDANFNGWEEPSGPFLDMTANEEETKPVYTVQYSSGTSFRAAEQRRDELIELGYKAVVVKDWGCYLVLTGSFDSREDAKAFRNELRSSTNHWSADVRQLELPESALK
jgi:hypothetical protein